MITNKILTKDQFASFDCAANKYLAEEQNKPKLDLPPLKRRAKSLRQQIDQFLGRVKRATNEALIEVYENEIVALQEQLRDVNSELADANRQNAPAPPRFAGSPKSGSSCGRRSHPTFDRAN